MIHPIRSPRSTNCTVLTAQGSLAQALISQGWPQGVTPLTPLPERTGSTVSSGALEEEHALNVSDT